MPWHLAWTPQALRDWAHLEGVQRVRILAKLDACLSDPERFLTRLQGSKYHRLRVGDYRAIVVLLIAGQTVEAQAIGHRSTVYDR